jgi:serine/threonine protein kinase
VVLREREEKKPPFLVFPSFSPHFIGFVCVARNSFHRRYMAPEVFLGHHYNVKADVYSWTMVLHAMLSLQRPFEMYDAQLHKLLVCQEGLRPTIYHEWPRPIQDLLRQGWAAQPKDRPPMGQISATLQGILLEIETAKASAAPSTPGGAAATTARSTSGPEQPSPSPSDDYMDHGWQEPSGCGSSSSTTVQQALVSLIDSWTSTMCVGGMHKPPTSKNGHNNAGGASAAATAKGRRNLLRTLEAHLVADAAGTHLLLRERLGTADYPQLMHLRSSYL